MSNAGTKCFFLLANELPILFPSKLVPIVSQFSKLRYLSSKVFAMYNFVLPRNSYFVLDTSRNYATVAVTWVKRSKYFQISSSGVLARSLVRFETTRNPCERTSKSNAKRGTMTSACACARDDICSKTKPSLPDSPFLKRRGL